MKDRRRIPFALHKLFQGLSRFRLPYKIVFFILGIASTLWFLIRVVPKPSRAAYPCMRAAAPIMSSFVIYLLSLGGSAMLFKRSRSFFSRARYLLAAAAFLGALILFAFSSNIFPERASAATQKAVPSDFPPNEPMGKELGIFPGRVVWEWDPDATNENCTNKHNYPNGEPDAYFLAKNNDQEVINRMMDDLVCKLTDTFNPTAAWDMLFVDFNKRKDRGEAGYQPGEKIFIKINQGGAGWLTRSSDLAYDLANWGTRNSYPNAETSGPMAVALLHQLIDVYGVAQEDIYIGDPNAHILKDNYDQMVALYPDVKYMDNDPQHADIGRTIINKTSEKVFIWSDPSTISAPEETQYSWEEVVNADYLINLADLKAHARAGVTLTAKNHFGTHANPGGAWPLHAGLVCYVDNDILNPARTQYGMYRVLTDIMGHEKLGGNTVLFIVEGLWGGPEAVSIPVKWQSAPFNNDWPSSILASQDAVALESVCFDLLKTEYNNPSSPGKDRPWYGGVDDHLHQAADSANWPEGIKYDPEGDGTPIPSMGVHEHWNNEVDKQYSRNLGYNYGIELIAPKSLVKNEVHALEAEVLPVIDGDPSDDCWQQAEWYYIDQTWINWGQEIDSSDFFGRFKMSWSTSENLLYYLVEITDDAFIDGYTYPDDGYYNYDVVEVFVDEDASGGTHTYDENAFAYHICVNAPADGETESSFYACDLADGGTRMNYADHIPQLSLKKLGNKYYYEFSMALYSDSYNDASPEDSRVTLAANKEIGLSMAYCDNDSPDGQRDNFFGSVWVPESEFNSHWQNADGFGRVRLIHTGPNQAVTVTGSIPDFEVTGLNTDLVVHDNLLEVFNDPDGDLLTYTVHCDETSLAFTIEGNVLKVNASATIAGSAEVSVSASDGQYEASVSFHVSTGALGIPRRAVNGQISCYPNPSAGLLHVETNLKSDYTGPVTLTLYNLAGASVITRDAEFLNGGKGTMSLNLAELPRGQYILRLRAGEELHSRFISKL
jgi:hypothetical protein